MKEKVKTQVSAEFSFRFQLSLSVHFQLSLSDRSSFQLQSFFYVYYVSFAALTVLMHLFVSCSILVQQREEPSTLVSGPSMVRGLVKLVECLLLCTLLSQNSKSSLQQLSITVN